MSLQPILRFNANKYGFKAWDKTHLSQIATVTMGQSPSSESYNEDSDGLPLIQGNADIVDGFTKPQRYTTEVTKRCQEGDVILSVRAPVGELGIASEESCIGRGVCAIRANDKSNTAFIYQLLQAKKKQWKTLEQGSTFTAVSGEDVKAFEVVVPTKEEQQKIASFFSIFDEKISITEKRIELFLNLKKWLMIKIFSREIRFKDENNSYYPEWCVKRLGDIATLKNGIAKSKSFFGHGSKFVNLQDVFCKSRLYNSSFGLVEVTEKELRENNLQKGDVLFVRSSVKPEGVGLPCLVEQDLDATTFSGFLIRCRFNATELTDSFKIHLFNSYTFRNEVLRRSTVSANTNINQDNLSIIPVAIPCKEEQKKISTLLDAIDDRIDLSIKKLNKIKTIKRGLLQAMFV